MKGVGLTGNRGIVCIVKRRLDELFDIEEIGNTTGFDNKDSLRILEIAEAAAL